MFSWHYLGWDVRSVARLITVHRLNKTDSAIRVYDLLCFLQMVPVLGTYLVTWKDSIKQQFVENRTNTESENEHVKRSEQQQNTVMEPSKENRTLENNVLRFIADSFS